MSKLTRENAILPFPTTTDLSQHIGEAVSITVIDGVAHVQLLPPSGAIPFGIILHADKENASIAPFAGGLGGTVKVKLQLPVQVGNDLYIQHTNGIAGFGDAIAVQPYNEYVCALALESGIAGELIEAVLFRPFVLSGMMGQ